MEIKGKVHCLFEQSGTFKNEFIKLGIPAEDYDIQNNFGQTNHIVDLFQHIEDAYDDKPSLFDQISGGQDLVLAFFPCIYFCAMSQVAFNYGCKNYSRMTTKQATDAILKRSSNREYFFKIAVKMIAIAKIRGLRLIMENPWSEQTFLKANFVLAPTIVDNDRMKRGDYFVKPTAYWFVNCEQTHGETIQRDKQKRTIMQAKKAKQAGMCSEERSMISPDYARNFICDWVIGKSQPHIDASLFDNTIFE